MIWLDFIALPQNVKSKPITFQQPVKRQPLYDFNDVLSNIISAIGQVVLCTDVKFTPFKRSWCLFELAVAHETKNVNYQVAMSRQFGRMDMDSLTKQADKVDVRNADARFAKDREDIHSEIIKQFDTYDKLNEIIKGIFKPRIDEKKAVIAGIL